MNYDVIVIGNTPVGRYAALTAAFWEARVALVTQDISFAAQGDWFYHFSLTQLTAIAQKWNNVQPIASPPLERYQQWGQQVIAVMEQEQAFVKLAAQGIDVIEGKGEFCRLPQQAFIVNDESLKAPAYLIATETSPIFPEVANLSEAGCLTLTDLRQKHRLETLPNNLTIIGESPEAISLAQNLAKLEKNITLSLPNSHLFAKEDEEIAYLLQAQLEGDGINLLTASALSDIRKTENGKWLQLGNHTMETEELIIVPEKTPNVEGLNLEGVKVDYTHEGLAVNRKLQTTNQNIYGCGGVIGGYPFFNLARYEAQIVLKNALFYPRHKVDYRTIPYLISIHPPLARVGLTERQAKRRYGNKVVVFKDYFKDNSLSIIQGELSGLLKLIVHQNGKIIGATGIGNNVGELVNIIAIALAKNWKMKQLKSVSFVSPSVSDLLTNIVQKWDFYYYQTHPLLRKLRKQYFLFRRNPMQE
ncbi:MAG: NAD(P)/FAD-dependent oxidoreductase [Cyanobacteria bacterium SW_9_44_58]|nr:MAG: NAD(P)/FAD-dependent oxidoreductase [Cyanobacteria bacterium SW_9_44_58]